MDIDPSSGAVSALIQWFREAGAASVPTLLIFGALFVTGRIYSKSTVDDLKEELKEARAALRERDDEARTNLEITKTAARLTADVVAEVIQRAPIPAPPPERSTRT